jgi:hypothetical protein
LAVIAWADAIFSYMPLPRLGFDEAIKTPGANPLPLILRIKADLWADDKFATSVVHLKLSSFKRLLVEVAARTEAGPISTKLWWRSTEGII